MTTTVTFKDRDPILAAIIRALADKAAGHQVVRGQDEHQLAQQGFYTFEFSRQRQSDSFKEWVEKYIADDFRASIQIEP